MQQNKGRSELFIIVVIVVLGFLLSGGLFAIKQNPNVQVAPGEPSSNSSGENKTLQLDTLQFVPTDTPPDPLPSTPPDIINNCGYSFYNESGMLYAYGVETGGAAGSGKALKVFFTDETPLLLGSGDVSLMQRHPSDHVSYPKTGTPTKSFYDHLLLSPGLYLTDVTQNGANSTAGDAENGGNPVYPSDIYGAWIDAYIPPKNNPHRKRDPRLPGYPKNGWADFQSFGGDPWSAVSNGPFADFYNSHPELKPVAQKYVFGTEVVWKLSDLHLIQAHMYRGEFVLHDSDGGSDGDVVEGCVAITGQ